jgi:hypothetical protein
MGVYLNKRDLQYDQLQHIASALSIAPKPKYDPLQKRYIQEAPILFFDATEEYVILPYAFTAFWCQKGVNQHKNFPRKDMTYTGHLRPKQPATIKDTLDYLQNFGCCKLIQPPGEGKTSMCVYMSCALKYLTCVLVHRKNIMEQWRNTFEERTNAVVWVVGEKVPTEPFSVIICMMERYDHIPYNIRMLVGFMIVDEAHRFCVPSAAPPISGGPGPLLAFEPKYVLVCTATLERLNGMESMMHILAGPYEVRKEFDENFKIVEVYTGLYFEVSRNKFGENYDEFLHKIFASDARNNIIVTKAHECITTATVSGEESRIIIMTSFVDLHAKPLTTLLQYYLHPRGISVSMYAGDNTYQDTQIVVVSVGKAGEGFDPSALMRRQVKPYNKLFMVTSFKSEPLLFQTMGRVVGRGQDPYVYDFYDDVKTSRKHHKARMHFMADELGGVIVGQESFVGRI